MHESALVEVLIGLNVVAGTAEHLTLGLLSREPLLAPGPDAVGRLVRRVDVVQLQLFRRATPDAHLVGKVRRSPAVVPRQLILPLLLPRLVRHYCSISA